MIYKTEVVWTAAQAQDPVLMQPIIDQAYNWESRQTAGHEVFTNEPVEGQNTLFRFWDTEAHAQEWVDFVLGHNPVSAVVVVTAE